METPNVIAVFTNRGARLKSWKLKHYLDGQKQPQELVESELEPLPFTLRTPDEQVNATLNSALYAVNGAPPDGTASPSPGSIDLRFEYRDSAGVHAVKEFHLDPPSYVVTLRATVNVGDRALPAAVVWGPAVGDHLAASSLIQGAQGLLLLENGSPTRLTASDIATQPAHEGNFRFAGVDDNYFMTAAIDPGASKVTFQPVSIPLPAGSKPATRELLSFTIEPQAGCPAEVLRRPEGPRRADGDRSRVCPRDQLRTVRRHRRAAAAVAEMGPRLRRQLGMVDRHPHDHHQPGDGAAAAQAGRVDAEDAGDSAGGEGDSGSLLEAEGDRSRASRR